MAAATNGHAATLDLLVTLGANVDQGKAGGSGATALHLAIQEGKLECVVRLLSNNASADVKKGNGTVPLHAAAAGGHADAARLLLDASADVNSRDDAGWTAHAIAASLGNLALVELLVSRGAKASAASGKAATAAAAAAAAATAAARNLQSRTPVRAAWQPDNTAQGCTHCKATFGFFFRRHHCRYCGKVVCSSCAPYSPALPRMCNRCSKAGVQPALPADGSNTVGRGAQRSASSSTTAFPPRLGATAGATTVTAAITCPTPKCNAEMELTASMVGIYASGWFCDGCTASSRENNPADAQRWHCSRCTIDFCRSCRNAAAAAAAAAESMSDSDVTESKSAGVGHVSTPLGSSVADAEANTEAAASTAALAAVAEAAVAEAEAEAAADEFNTFQADFLREAKERVIAAELVSSLTAAKCSSIRARLNRLKIRVRVYEHTLQFGKNGSGAARADGAGMQTVGSSERIRSQSSVEDISGAIRQRSATTRSRAASLLKLLSDVSKE